MSEADGTIRTTVTRKRKRGSRFKFSSKKAIEHSRLSKEIAKGRVLELGSVKKALTYPSELWSVVDLAKCSTGSLRLASLHSVDENQEERIDVSIRLVVSVAEYFEKVSILRYMLH
jgi:hypothetical protein